MILSHKGHLVMDGSRGELFIEFVAIFESILEDDPALIAACSIEYEADLLKALKDVNPKEVEAAHYVVKEFKKGNANHD